ncbi:hypothetical protein ACVINW_003605 [Bradyrhizobium sp. USDA 4461]
MLLLLQAGGQQFAEEEMQVEVGTSKASGPARVFVAEDDEINCATELNS